MRRDAAVQGVLFAGVPVARALLGAVLASMLLPAAAGAQPKPTASSQVYDVFEHTFPRPVARQLDPARWIRRMAGNPREAANVDDHDQVRLPSTWWQPRVGFQPVTVEQMLRGPGPGAGPAPGRWKVTKGKSQGVTPGFWIKDAEGTTFILKFDPGGYPEMATATDVIASHLFWAAGYNVPDNAVAYFRAESLDVGSSAAFTDEHGRKRGLTRDDLHKILARVRQEPDGSYRAIASRLLKGKPLGPFQYVGRRADDPEDLIPHQHRREVRGLWAMAAWLNHTDIRSINTLDMWVKDGGREFVRHYLIDFGACLGSASTTRHDYNTGTEYYVDYGVSAQQLATLGLRRFAWEPTADPKLPSIGFIESQHFDPKSWRPDYPNPAFDERTTRDIRWGAGIVAAMSDELIRAAVAAGKYSDPRASDYLTKVLIERRDRIMHQWSVPSAVASAAH